MENIKAQIGKKQIFMAILIFFIAFNLLSGCASRSQTTHTETVTSPSAQTTVTTQETTKTSEDSHRSSGVLGGALHVVGEVLAFPFDVVAGLFRFIF